MKIRSRLIVAIFSILPAIGFCQQKDTLIKKLDSASKTQPDTSKNKHNVIKQENYNETTKINGRTYFILLFSDVQQQLTSPFHIKAKDWGEAGVFAVATGAMLLADEPVNRFAVDLRDHNRGVVNVSKWVTRFGGMYEAYTLGSLALYGFVFQNEKIKTTTFLASQAYITSAIIFEATKFLTGRQRPNYYDPETHENNPTWHGPFYQ